MCPGILCPVFVAPTLSQSSLYLVMLSVHPAPALRRGYTLLSAQHKTFITLASLLTAPTILWGIQAGASGRTITRADVKVAVGPTGQSWNRNDTNKCVFYRFDWACWHDCVWPGSAIVSSYLLTAVVTAAFITIQAAALIYLFTGWLTSPMKSLIAWMVKLDMGGTASNCSLILFGAPLW